jgi:hypothetical protein
MRRLFAEAFLVSLLDPEQDEPVLHYDEERALTLLSDGRPFIETGHAGRAFAGRTDTLTEVRAEQDDFDAPDDDTDMLAQLSTLTKVRAERDDFASPEVMFATETRQAPGEQDDFCRSEANMGTETAVGGESDDFARGERAVGTQTFVRRESDDVAWGEHWAGTKTAVRGEADDFSAEPEPEVPSRGASFAPS